MKNRKVTARLRKVQRPPHWRAARSTAHSAPSFDANAALGQGNCAGIGCLNPGKSALFADMPAQIAVPDANPIGKENLQ